MTLFDSLLTARNRLDAWLLHNPAHNGAHSQVFTARQQLSQALVTIENNELQDALEGLETDAESLRDAADRLTNISQSIDEVQNIVNDVGIIVPILQKVIG